MESLMKPGDRILIPHHYGDYDDEVFVIEEFRQCLGYFYDDAHRLANDFTPLCNMYEPGPDSKVKYISNFGEYYTNTVQAWADLPKD